MSTITIKEKVCTKCGKTYAPTGNCQKYCSDCAGSKEKKPIKQKPIQAPVTIVQNEDSMVLKMLIAIGIVSEEKVEEARQIVSKLKA